MTGETAAVVVTSCSKRKSLAPAADLRAESLPPGSPAAVAEDWAERLAATTTRIPARDLYLGRAFREAAIAARAIGASKYVISAGLGLIPVELEIPAYSLTVASGPDNILSRLTSEQAVGPAAWWRELRLACGCASFEDLVAASSGPILIAASSSYISMIAPELDVLQDRVLGRVRLFTAARRNAIPAFLEPLVMPYDTRLEGLPGRSGTLSDFGQRALRHFSERVLPGSPRASASEHALAVRAALASVQAPPRRRGRTLSDPEIIALICQNWERTGSKSAASLRLLRDSYSVACEQNRFKKLFAAARLEMTP